MIGDGCFGTGRLRGRRDVVEVEGVKMRCGGVVHRMHTYISLFQYLLLVLLSPSFPFPCPSLPLLPPSSFVCVCVCVLCVQVLIFSQMVKCLDILEDFLRTCGSV